MNKRAVLRCDGSLEEGFRVALEISDSILGLISEAVGELPASLELISALEQWQQSYRNSLARGAARISLESVSVETGSLSQLESCRNLGKTLESLLKSWLSHPNFQEIEQRLRESLNANDEVAILLRTRDLRLYQLPWHNWGFIQRYPKAELVLSTPSERLETSINCHQKVRILAILGDRRGIDTDVDRQILQKTPNSEVMFLVEPSRQFLYRYLWEQSWDILFFAGHSHTAAQQGMININSNEQLSLEDLKYGLKKAIARGLQLAIFNSCDGLGLAYELEQLHIPQLIVMREPVPDRVAQEFLKRFLQTFSSGESLHASVRQAREWLQSLEGEFPCASWLPILFQNPAMEPLNWNVITQREERLDKTGMNPSLKKVTKRRIKLRGAVAMGLLVGGLVVGGRSLGWLNRSELWAYDRMTQIQFNTVKSVSQETSKIRVIGITKQDTQKYRQGITQENIISDRALAQLITKINQYKPKVIGLDIARDTPQPDLAGYKQLLNTLQLASSIVLACQVGEDDQAEQQAIPSIAAPKLAQPKPVGYADSLLNDDDGIVRRYILQMSAREGSACQPEQSFAWQIANQALQPQPLDLKSNLSADFGGYQGDPAQFGENQILINYHPSSRNLKLYSLEDVMYLNTERELQQLFKDNVVLIGYNIGGSEDTHATPIGQQNGVMLHTYALRQLLRQTPEIRAWSQWQEGLWTMIWSIGGSLLLWRIPSVRGRIFLGVSAVILLQILVYTAYLQSMWIPLVPATVALILSVVLVWLLEKTLRLKGLAQIE